MFSAEKMKGLVYILASSVAYAAMSMLINILGIANQFMQKASGETGQILSFIRTKKQIQEFYNDLDYFVQDIYFWRLDQFKEKQSHPPKPQGHQSAKPRWGRNQPCPCGSGKKFKQCCGKN